MSQVINVVKKFILRIEEGMEDIFGEGVKEKTYDVGVHTVDDDVASHWFVKAHTTAVEEVKPSPSADEVAAAKAVADDAKKALAEAEARAAAAEAKAEEEAKARAQAEARAATAEAANAGSKKAGAK